MEMNVALVERPSAAVVNLYFGASLNMSCSYRPLEITFLFVTKASSPIYNIDCRLQERSEENKVQYYVDHRYQAIYQTMPAEVFNRSELVCCSHHSKWLSTKKISILFSGHSKKWDTPHLY